MMVTKGYKISLKALRINGGFSLPDIAGLLKIPEATVEAWEEYSASPTLEQAELLSVIYGVELEDLTYGKFKPAKEILFNNLKMLKKASEKGYEYLKTDENGEIIGFRKSPAGEIITE